MKLNYGPSKAAKCYRDFVQNPENRKAVRAFEKMFGKPLLAPAKKLHDRLIQYESAGDYNKTYGSTDNRIELMKGVSEREPLILKVRIGMRFRKFFYHQLDEAIFLFKKDWVGDFNSVISLYVFEINNHNYIFRYGNEYKTFRTESARIEKYGWS